MRLSARIRSSATGSLTVGKQVALHDADAVLGRDRAAVFQHDVEHDLVHVMPALEERGLVGADRLGDVVVDVAVAEMAERQRPRAGDELRRPPRRPRAMKAGTCATGTETSCLIEPPTWRCTSPNISRMRQNALACSRLSAMAASLDEPALDALGRGSSSSVSRRPARACEDSSISTYQGCGARSGSRQPARVLAAPSRCPIRSISSKLRDAAAGALGGDAEQLQRRLRRGDADEGGLDRARARHQPQHRGGDDAERAFGADEQVLQIVAGIVLLQLVEVVEHAPVGQHHLEAERMRARDAVGERRGAAGIGREIAADRAGALRRQQLRIEPVDRRPPPRARAAR